MENRLKNLNHIKILLLVLLIVPFISSCRSAAERMELTNYIGDTINEFKRGTRVKLTESTSGVYVLEDKLQLMAPEGKIASITVLEGSEEFTIHGLSIGMDKTQADTVLDEIYDAGSSKTVSNKGIVHTYITGNTELYISYDIDNDNIVEISYYNYKTSGNEQDNWELTTDGELIAIIDDIKVFYNEAIIYLKSVQDNYEGEYGKDVWDVDIYGDGNSFGSIIKEEVIKQITQLKIIREKASEMEVELDAEELDDAKRYAKEHFHGLSDKDINKYHITLDLLEEIYLDNSLAEKMFETLTINVDTQVPDEEAKQITVWDILIQGNDDNGHAKAQGILDQAHNTEDFYELAETNTDAEYIEYTFGKGQGPEEYGEAFEKAAFNLSTGEVSELIETEDGWHIIYCVSDFNEDATIQAKEEIIQQRRLDMFAQLYEQWSAEYDVIINSQAWDSVTFDN